MSKDQAIIELADDIARQINPEGLGLVASQAANVCTLCPRPADKFRDALSEKEYRISGMCQVCQDSVFGGPDDL